MSVVDVLPRHAGADPVPSTSEPASAVGVPRSDPVRGRSVEAWLVFAVAFAGYLALAGELVFTHGYLPGDSLARVGNAYGVMAGRDPHLAAIGFVWSPLPTAAIGALLPFRLIWPALVTHGFAACIVSAAAMAAMLVAVRGTLADLRVPRMPRLLVVGLLGAHPMIVWYAINGMSEAVGLLFLCLACRSLTRWIDTGSVAPLVSLGIWLGSAYLSRYEAISAAAAALALVAGMSMVRASGTVRDRARMASVDVGLVAFSVVVAVVGWAAVSWLIVKHPFEQFSSEYGNSSQVEASIDAIRVAAGGEPLQYVAEQVEGLMPVLGVAVALAVVFAVVRGRWSLVVPLVILAPVAASQAFLAQSEQTFVWLRFQIVVVPMAALCVGVAMTPLDARRRWAWPIRWAGSAVAAVVVAAALGPALPVAADTLLDRRLAREEAAALRTILQPESATEAERRSTLMLRFGDVVAGDLADFGPGRGSILTDTAFSFPVVLAAADPAWFVMRSDRDFEAALARPWIFGVRYLLVPSPTGRAVADAVNAEYPDLWTGDPLASKVREWTDQYGTQWGLFAITPPQLATGTPADDRGRASGSQVPAEGLAPVGTVGAEEARLDAVDEVDAKRVVDRSDAVDR